MIKRSWRLMIGAMLIIFGGGGLWWANSIKAGEKLPITAHKMYKYPLVLASPLVVEAPPLTIFGREFFGRTIPAGSTVSREQVINAETSVYLKPPMTGEDLHDLYAARYRLGHDKPVEVAGDWVVNRTPDGDEYLPASAPGSAPGLPLQPAILPPPKSYKYPLVLAHPLEVKKPSLIVGEHSFFGRTVPVGGTISPEEAVDAEGPVVLRAPLADADWANLDARRHAQGHTDGVQLGGPPPCVFNPQSHDWLPTTRPTHAPPPKAPPTPALLPLTPAERRRAAQDPFSADRMRGW